MTLENEKRVFGTLYDPIKSIVIMSGRNALKAPMLAQIITTDEQLRLLLKIVSNNKHPWIKEYDLKVRSFENSIAQEQVKKSLRKKRLKKVIKKSLWKRFSVKQKVKLVIKKSLYYLVLYIFAIGVMFLFFAIGFDGL
jgi:hypothetical protein